MNALRFIAFAVVLLILTPVIALKVWGINMIPWAMSALDPDEAVLTDAPEAQPIPQSPLTWSRDQASLRDTFSVDALTTERIVSITQILEPQELVGPNTAIPADVFLPLYAAARAPARLIRHCDEILQTIGTKCDVIHSDSHQNRDGKIVLSGRLAFVPAADLGDPSTVENGALTSATITLSHEGDLLPANDATARAAAMQQAQGICDDLRMQFGNCVLSRVDFEIEELWITDLEILPAGTNPQRLRVSASFDLYADETVLDQDRLRTLLHEMTGQT